MNFASSATTSVEDKDSGDDQALLLILAVDWEQFPARTTDAALMSAWNACVQWKKKVDAWVQGRHTGRETACCKWRVGGVFFRWSAPAGPELAEMSQRKLTRQLRLWESPEGPPLAPSALTSPVSPDDQSRGHGGSSLFRRLKLNRSIQERRRSSHCIYRYSSPRHLYWTCPSVYMKIAPLIFLIFLL